MEEMICRKAKL